MRAAQEVSSTGPSAATISSGNAAAILARSIVDRGERRAEHLGRLGRVRPFVRARTIEADRERRHGLAALASAQAEDDCRVETAADIAHDRHVAPQPALDSLAQQVFELVHQRRGVVEPALVTGVGKVEVPVLLLLDPAVLHLQKVAGRKRLDALEEGPRRAGAEKREQVIDALGHRAARRPVPRPAVP